MKKLLALLLALVMALSCVGALAEEAAPTVQNMTLTGGVELNAEQVTQLSALFGAGSDEQTAALIQGIIRIINNLGVTAVIADNGCQADVTLKDGTLLTVAAAANENGLAAVTDLLPDYVFTVSGETVQQLMGQMQEMMSSGTNLDMNAIMEIIAPHMEKITAYVNEKTGEPEPASVTFEDVEFTVKVPFNLETKEMLTLCYDLVKDLASSEALAPVFSQVEGFDVSKIEALSQQLAETDPADLPVMAAAMYTNENGDVYVNVNAAKDDETVNVDMGVFSDRMCVRVDVAGQGQIAVDVAPAENGFAVSLKISAQGMTAAVAANFAAGEEGMLINADVYFMTLEQPLASLSLAIVQGGEITYPIDPEGKTVVSVEELMQQGEESETAQQLMGSLQNSLFVIITKAQQLMPDEIGALMSLLMPAESSVAVGE